MSTKEDIVLEIARAIGLKMPPPMSTGSTEPKAIFIAVNEELGLGLENRSTKPELARGIVESAGRDWSLDCESRGGTVTKSGLLEVLEAVKFFTKR